MGGGGECVCVRGWRLHDGMMKELLANIPEQPYVPSPITNNNTLLPTGCSLEAESDKQSRTGFK